VDGWGQRGVEPRVGVRVGVEEGRREKGRRGEEGRGVERGGGVLGGRESSE